MKDSEIFTFIKNFKDWTVVKTKLHELNYTIQADPGIQTTYVIFQESNGKKDWKDNLNFLPISIKPYKNQETVLKVHRGFAREYKSGNDEVLASVKAAIESYPGHKIVVSGWSNGGAVALLCAEDIFFNFKIRPDLITFGAPKVCANKKTAAYVYSCIGKATEYCHKSDMVTTVPPGFCHVAKYPLGEFSLKHFFQPKEYHTRYDEFIREEVEKV